MSESLLRNRKDNESFPKSDTTNSQYSKVSSYVKSLTQHFKTGKTKPYSWRIKQLWTLHTMLKENVQELGAAVYKDLKRAPTDTELVEIEILKSDIMDVIHDLKSWMEPVYGEKSLLTLTCKSYCVRDPYGVCLVLGPWNYPISCVIGPLIGAIAGGNVCLVKPSELTPETGIVIKSILEKYMDNQAIKCLVLDRYDSEKMIQNEKFDHIFFTGGTNIGKIIMKEASKNLTKCVLELGGKNPTYVADDCDFKYTARKIIYSKYLNNGQTCIAPDYIICSSKMQDKLIEETKIVLKEFYPKGLKQSEDYSRIVNNLHCNRLTSLIERMPKEKLALGGNYDKDEKFIHPTIFKNVSLDDPIMEGEIFGPILAILPVVDNLDQAIEFINNLPKPLAAYIFSENSKSCKKFINSTYSGACLANEMIIHFAVNQLPFGGVGDSGMGSYHGKYSFDCYTHEKAVLEQSWAGKMLLGLVVPPGDSIKHKILKMTLNGFKYNVRPIQKFVCFLVKFLSYFALLYFIYEQVFAKCYGLKWRFEDLFKSN